MSGGGVYQHGRAAELGTAREDEDLGGMQAALDQASNEFLAPLILGGPSEPGTARPRSSQSPSEIRSRNWLGDAS